MAVLPLQLHRTSLSHGAEKILLDSFGLLWYCPDDLASFSAQAEAEDPEYIELAPNRTVSMYVLTDLYTRTCLQPD